MPDKKYLGELLLTERLITTAQLKEALQRQGRERKPLGETLVDLQYLDQQHLSRILRLQEDTQPGTEGHALAAPARQPWYHRTRIPIKFKAAVIIILIIIGLVLPISFLVLDKQNRQSERRMMSFGTALMNTFANYSAESVLQEDWPALDPFIREIGKLEEVRYVLILDQTGTIKAHSDVSRMEKKHQMPETFTTIIGGNEFQVIRYREPSGEPTLDFSRVISYQGKPVGRVHLGISETSMIKDARALRLYILMITLAAVAFGIGISYGAGDLISRSLTSLIRGTREIGGGNLDYRIPPAGNDELGDLARAFNEMADGLKKKELIQTTFGRYVTPEIVGMILSNPEEIWLKGSRKAVTVLFADIRNFTAFSEDREPEEVVGVLNQFFTMATDHILAENGYVNKFHGDEVMAVFGAPMFYEDHAQRAVRTAVRLQRALEEWNRNREREGKQAVRAGIGVNSGLVVAGNLGSEQKMEYTVIGDDVNLAARLTSIAGSGEIIISDKTRELVHAMAILMPLEPITVKGKKHPVMIYRIEGLSDAAG